MSKTLQALVAALCLLAAPLYGQSPTIQKPLTSTACPGAGCVILNVAGMGAGSIQAAGTFTGTIEFEVSVDGATYTSLAMTPAAGGSAVTSTTSAGVWASWFGGYNFIRARASALSAGPATVTISAALGLAAPGLSGVVLGNGVQPATATVLPSDATKYLDGTGAFSSISGIGAATITGALTFGNAVPVRTDTTTAHTFLIQGYDVDGTAYKTFITVTNGNTPDMTIAVPSGGTLTIQPSTYKSSDGTTGATVTTCTAFKNGLCVSGS